MPRKYFVETQIKNPDGTLGGTQTVEYLELELGMVPYIGQQLVPILLGLPTISLQRWLGLSTGCGQTQEPEPEPSDEPTDLVDSYGAIKAVKVRRDPVNTQGSFSAWVDPNQILDFQCFGPAGYVTKKFKTFDNTAATDAYRQYQSLGVMPVGPYRLYLKLENQTKWMLVPFTVTANYDEVVYEGTDGVPSTWAIVNIWEEKATSGPVATINFVATDFVPSIRQVHELCNASGPCRMKLEAMDGQTGFNTDWYQCSLIDGTASSGTYEGRWIEGLPTGRYRSIAAPVGVDDPATWKSKEIEVTAANCQRPATGLVTYKLVTGVTYADGTTRVFADHADACQTVQNVLAQQVNRPVLNFQTVQIASLAAGQTVYKGATTDCSKQQAGYGYLYANDNTDLRQTIQIGSDGKMVGEEQACFYDAPGGQTARILAIDWWTIDTGVDDTFLFKTSENIIVEFDYKFDQETNWTGYAVAGTTIDPSGLDYQRAFAITPQPGATSYVIRARLKAANGTTFGQVELRFIRPNPQVRTTIYQA